MSLIKENEKSNPSDYSANLIKNTTKEFSSLLDKQEHDWINNYAQNNLERYAFDFDAILNNIPEQSSICEIGAAPFFFTCVLKNAGYKVSAVDIAPERFKNINELGVEIKKADIDHDILSFKNNSFDSVVINEIFEHLKGNLIFSFQEIHRILKPEGILILSTPNLKSIKGILNFFLKSKAYASANSLYEE